MAEVSATPRTEIRDRIVRGNVWTTVWWLAWPSLITMVLQTANGLIDGLFVGRLGKDALAAVGTASQAMMVLMSISMAAGVGASALVARFVGAGEMDDAEHAARQSFLLAIIMSIAFGVPAYLTGRQLLAWMGATGEALRLGTLYLDIQLLGVTPFFIMMILTGIYRGLGDTRTPLIVMLIATAVSLAGDYVLIFGVGPFPRLGVAGAGIATLTSRVIAMTLFMAFLPKTHLPRCLRGCWLPSLSWFARILNIGMPAALQGLLRTGALMTYFRILGLTPEATYAIAALTIGLRMEALAFMPGMAFSVAATSMVGQNLGARQADRAEKGAWAATWQGIWVMGAMGLAFIVFSHDIAHRFAPDDPKVVALAASYLWLNGLTEGFLAMGMILTGALQGAGETRLPSAATIITLWFIRLPLTYYLAITQHLGAWGAWAAMSGSTMLNGLAILAVFKLSKWKEIEV